MSKVYKRLGATTVVANTDTTLYTVPVATEAVVGEITICNRGSTQHTYRLAHVDGAIGVVANEDYKFYDTPIDGNHSIVLNIGLSMAASNTILVRANHADVNFSCSGVEIS